VAGIICHRVSPVTGWVFACESCLYGTRGFGPVSIADGRCFRPRRATPVPPASPRPGRDRGRNRAETPGLGTLGARPLRRAGRGPGPAGGRDRNWARLGGTAREGAKVRARVIKDGQEMAQAAGIAPDAKSWLHTPWPCTGATGPAPAAAVDAAPAMPGSLALAAGQQNTNPRMV
jgi:hypothetical protein